MAAKFYEQDNSILKDNDNQPNIKWRRELFDGEKISTVLQADLSYKTETDKNYKATIWRKYVNDEATNEVYIFNENNENNNKSTEAHINTGAGNYSYNEISKGKQHTDFYINPDETLEKLNNKTYDIKRIVKKDNKSVLLDDFTELAKISTENNILTSISNDIKNIYGNSLFCLSTVHDNRIDEDEKLKHIMLYGVMREMPEIGFKSTWEDGPGSTAKTKLKNFVKSDELEAIQFFGKQQISHIVFSDGWTAKVYDNSEINSVTLKFRVYGNQDIGPVKMTSYEDWVYALSTFTPVASDANTTNLSDIGTQIDTTSNAVSDAASTVKDVLSNLLKNTSVNDNYYLYDFENNANIFLQKYNGKRVHDNGNAKNKFGAKLFNLHIYPFIFKKTIPVFVSSWNFTPSKEVYEININEEKTYKSLYYDFNITLETDQLPSQSTFNNIMTV